jgi:ribosomal protein S18
MISMSQKPQNNFWVIFLTIVTIAVLLTLVSCNGSKKAKSSSKTETITVFVRDTVHVKVVDTTKLTTELQEFVTKTIEIFDTTYTEVPQIRQRIIYENIKMRKEMRENGISKDSTTARTNFAQSETVATNSQTKETKRTPWYLILGIVFIVLFYMTGKKYNVLR